MAPLEVYKPFTPPCTSPSALASTHDTSSSSSDDDSSAALAPRSRCMHPGRRLVHGRIYDSVLGVTCHWCRQKTVEDHVFCCHCNIAFCGGCLKNRHGEDIKVEMKDDVQWTCPKCRGGCGPGCNNCCNCGPCRKAQGLEPTGLLVHTARSRGFTNVHDYLIYQKTGECEEIIERRKHGKGWCQTDPSSFRKKQKRIESDKVDVSCRKRLNFTPNASQAEEKSPGNYISALQTKEVGLTANSHSVQALKSKEDEKVPPSASKDTVLIDKMLENDEKASMIVSKATVNLQLTPVQNKYIQKNLQSRAASVSEEGTLVQPKPEPESVPLQQATPSHAPVEPNSHKSVENCKFAVKQEPLDLDVHLKKGSNVLLKVKTEEVLLDHGSSASKHGQVSQHSKNPPSNFTVDKAIDQPVQKRNGSISQLKAEIRKQGLKPGRDGANLSANSQADKCDTPCCTFSLDPVVSSQSMDFHVSPGNSNFYLFPETNFHLYPETSASMLSNGKEVVDGQHLKSQDCKVKLESVSSEDAQCNMAQKVYMDVSCSGRPKVDNFVPLAAVKEEREDNWNAHCPPLPTKSTTQTNSLFGTVKVKTEREDFSFTIDPPSIFKDGRVKSKEETFAGTPVSKSICIDDDVEPQTLTTANPPETSAGLGKSSCGSFGDVSHLWKADDFKKKLEARVSEPFSREELETLTVAASHRKPIYKARETRQGCSQFVSEEEGHSYLDHHPDLAQQLEQCGGPIFRLSLLRGFFFWLEHASMLGAFKPWTSVSDTQENDDCIEIDGPDCAILAVVCSVD
ncbi:hypothetical protein GOP47_0026076 [Adiantum capillus-veneris]|uniref:RING-type domain-containing protein n=1 Tax=Adiantum capillus-veneris TaxID=13818 RepID=A0A9D4U242_ADICA|nr:hypothetical protein GOP47_0025598 [Adiantum capillus-veneris]KAI5059757.1 hypothetical protein GOP47_0026076 [Adiantum capillus-veneris]